MHHAAAGLRGTHSIESLTGYSPSGGGRSYDNTARSARP